MISEQTRNKLTTIAENEQKVYDNGVADGKRAGVDETKLAIWNAITAYGAREHYSRAFYEGDYTDFTFPKPIKVKGSAGRIFYNYRGTKLPRKEDIDLSETDVSYTGNDDLYGVNNAFGWASKVTFIPDYGIPAPAKYYLTYANISKVIEIEKIRSKETTVWDRPFENAKSLITLQVEGVIGTSFPIPHSPLSPASLKSIVKHLKNYVNTSSEFAYTLTVKASAWQALESEGLTDEDYRHIFSVFPDINPTIVDSWDTFVTAWLRWNLVLA